MPPRKKAEVPPRGGEPKTANASASKRRSQASQTPRAVGTRRSKRLEEKQTLNKAPEILATTQAAPESKAHESGADCGTAISRPNQDQSGERAQLYSKLSAWLEKAGAIASEGLGAFDSAQSESEEGDGSIMAAPSQCSLASIRTSEVTSTQASTIKPPPKSKPKKPNLESFRTRRVEVMKPRKDKLTTDFKKYLVEKRIKIPFRNTRDLSKSWKEFERKAEAAGDDEDSWNAVEELCKEMNRWKAKMRLATITNEDLQDDLEHCKYSSNEAVFQRTVMMSIIDRNHLKKIFDFNCEGKWSLGQSHPLPSTSGGGDVISSPKPDLAIFFRLDSLIGTDSFEASQPIPPELKDCIIPEKDSQRCFPFIFIEAKKGFTDIQPAAFANMHSASQALYNIYKWMNRANEDDAFFDHVRLFSIAINAREFIARVHRARLITKGNEIGLAFSYDDLYPEEQVRYSRDQVCTLIHNILVEYAENKLLGILKTTVNKVVGDQYQGVKRKSDTDFLDRPSKMVASAYPGASASDPVLVNTSTSFGMSQVEINDG